MKSKKIKICYTCLTVLVLFLPIFLLGQQLKSDTVFLQRSKQNGVYHAVFIERNKNAVFYNKLTDFQDCLSFKPTEKISKWMPVYLYQGKYYLYYPSDFFNHTRIMIGADSCHIYNSEGLADFKIKAIQTKTKHTKLYEIMDADNHIAELKIHAINDKRGIAVFEFIESDNQSSYLLMVNTKSAKRFPIIVNYSPEQKQSEFQFEQPNFEQLIKNN